ncbi:MAG: S1 family peptidase [bacterium]
MMVNRSVRVALSVIVIAVGMWASQRPEMQGQSLQVDAADAVFQIATIDRQPGADGIYHGHGFGTGFFIAADGTALTVSHIVYLAAHSPERYRLQALVGKEFYDASVICASRLPYDPSKPDIMRQGVPYSRDVAEVKLAPSTMPEGHRELFYTAQDGTRIIAATAHLDPLPEFPFLTVGGHPDRHVRIIGYGAISAIPYRWTAEGQVSRMWSTRDGTAVFDVTSSNPAVPGDSGAPVLTDDGRVIGLWTWHYYDRPDTGTAQEANALVPACR